MASKNVHRLLLITMFLCFVLCRVLEMINDTSAKKRQRKRTNDGRRQNRREKKNKKRSLPPNPIRSVSHISNPPLVIYRLRYGNEH